MKALVIPDVHLKPYMFKEAAEWMRKGVADRAVCLMDIPDDWNREYDIELYAQTFDAAISLQRNSPTLCGVTGIMIYAICGMSGNRDTVGRQPIRSEINWRNLRRHCRPGIRFGTYRGSMMYCSAMAASYRHL